MNCIVQILLHSTYDQSHTQVLVCIKNSEGQFISIDGQHNPSIIAPNCCRCYSWLIIIFPHLLCLMTKDPGFGIAQDLKVEPNSIVFR